MLCFCGRGKHAVHLCIQTTLNIRPRTVQEELFLWRCWQCDMSLVLVTHLYGLCVGHGHTHHLVARGAGCRRHVPAFLTLGYVRIYNAFRLNVKTLTVKRFRYSNVLCYHVLSSIETLSCAFPMKN